jgi:hypothetical protein
MIVAMTVGGIALALIGAVSLRQQRVFTDLTNQSAVAQQLREASALLPITLRSLSPVDGDLRDARDTAFEFRSTIAAAVVCDTNAGAVILPPIISGSSLGAIESPIEAGDSIWLYGALGWTGSAISSVTSAPAGTCAPQGPILSSIESKANRTLLRTTSQLSPSIGAPLRVTRPTRLSLYHASDGGWYLGERDWNNGTARFNTIQPVAGPLLSPSAGGVVFRYSDSAGVRLTTPVSNLSAVAVVRIEMRSQSASTVLALRSAQGSARPVDSSIVVIGLRGRE